MNSIIVLFELDVVRDDARNDDSFLKKLFQLIAAWSKVLIKNRRSDYYR